MEILIRLLLPIYLLVCIAVVIILYRKDSETTITLGKREFKGKTFLLALVLCLAFTPLIYIVTRKGANNNKK